MSIDPQKAVERLEKQYKRQNEHIKANYKRPSITIKNEIYDQIKAIYGDNIKMNGYISDLILSDISKHTNISNIERMEDSESGAYEAEDIEKLQKYLDQLKKDNEERKEREKMVDRAQIENALEEPEFMKD